MSENNSLSEDAPPLKKPRLEQENESPECEQRSKEDKNASTTPLHSSILEKEVGITEYLCSHKGISGILKQRYSDFIVNEVNLNGEVVHLTDLETPPEITNPSNLDPIKKLLSEDNVEQLKLVESGEKESTVIEVANDKELRTKIHQAIRNGFSQLSSETVDSRGETKDIKVTKTKLGDRQSRWPADVADYCKFVLYKENKDTMDAISLIAKNLRNKPNRFQYAGTKDKRGKTTQEVTVYRIPPKELWKTSKTLRNIVLGNFCYLKKPLKLAHLNGNRFTIIIRDLRGSTADIDKCLQSLKTEGFINYYGLQRFGTTTIPTHHIGQKILIGNWKEAVELIMKPRPGEEEVLMRAREGWWKNRDSKAALSALPRYCHIEMSLLQTLQRDESNYANAVNKISRNTRLLYVHAYQSYVWNCMVSRRIKEFGLQVVKGDLVSKDENNLEFEPGNGDGDNKVRVKPVTVTEENIQDFTVYDVVLPLPGFDVLYPSNEGPYHPSFYLSIHTNGLPHSSPVVKHWYKDMLQKDGLDIDNMRHKVKDFSLPGAYRRMVMIPGDLTWDVLQYNDYTIPLILSDYDKMNNEKEPESVKDGKFTALKMEFTLKPSNYATMAVREVLKEDTSIAHQSSLNIT